MSNEIKIKSNGLRNELKEIRKSIDTLTGAIVDIADILDIATNKQTYEKFNSNGRCNGDCKNDVLQSDV